MLTYIVDAPTIRDDRAAYRLYRVRVARIERMTPHFARVTFRGDELAELGTDGLDQRVKLIFPLDGAAVPDLGADDPESVRVGDWYTRWRELDAEIRPPFRTYTVRSPRPVERELDIDFVDHGLLGPAARWLSAAQVGDELVVCAATSLSVNSSVGIDWHPGPATRVLLVGDETAAPAVCSILESLPDDVEATAFLEVPGADDVLALSRNGDAVTWLSRGDGAHGSVLEPAVREWVGRHRDALLPALRATPDDVADVDVDTTLLWDSPVDAGLDFYAWLAGEAAMIKSLRRFLVSETGIDRRQVAFMGYWRLGKAEAQE